MNRRTRFAIWHVCVAALLLIHPILCLGPPRTGVPSAAAWVLAGVSWLGLLALLCTTPPDAIKLPVRRSVLLITLGTAWLAATHVSLGERTSSAWIGATALTVATAALAASLGRRRASPWWAVVLAWNPLFVGPGGVPLLYAAVVTAAVAIVVRLTRSHGAESVELTP